MKFKSIAMLFVAVAASSFIIMGASGGCGSDLHKASVAADSLANSLNTAAGVNHQLIASGQESAAEGEAVAKYIDAAAKANDTFIAEISSAEQTGAQVNAASLVSAFGTVTAAIQTLQSQGVLGLKSPAAQAAFQGVVSAINAQIAILQGLISTSTADNRGAPLKRNAPLLSIALTAEEIETLIGLVSTALGAGVPLVEKLLAMKGETDATLLSDATAQDATAEKQAEADEGEQATA